MSEELEIKYFGYMEKLYWMNLSKKEIIEMEDLGIDMKELMRELSTEEYLKIERKLNYELH